MHAEEANKLAEEGFPMKSAAEAVKHAKESAQSAATGAWRRLPSGHIVIIPAESLSCCMMTWHALTMQMLILANAPRAAWL